MVQRGYAHPRHGRQLFHVQRLCVVGPEPGDRSGRSVAQIACGGDGAKALALRRAQYAIDDFTLDQVAEKRNILGSLQQTDQPRAGIQQTGGRFADGKPREDGVAPASGSSSRLTTSRTVGISRRRNIESIGTCSDASTIWLFGGNIDGRQQKRRSVAVVDGATKVDALSSLHEDGKAGLVSGQKASRRRGSTIERKAGDRGGIAARPPGHEPQFWRATASHLRHRRVRGGCVSRPVSPSWLRLASVFKLNAGYASSYAQNIRFKQDQAKIGRIGKAPGLCISSTVTSSSVCFGTDSRGCGKVRDWRGKRPSEARAFSETV